MDCVPNCQKITGNSRVRNGLIKAEDGSELSSGEYELARQAEHFCEVLNRPVPVIQAQVEDPQDTPHQHWEVYGGES